MIINGHTPGLFYFTNIDHERVLIYRPTMEDVLSKVTVKADDVMNAFYTAFPLLKEVVAQIYVASFSTGMNKWIQLNKSYEFPKLKLIEDERKILMSTYVKNKDTGEYVQEDILVGTLLSDNDPEFYDEIIKNYEKFSDTIVRRTFKANEVAGDDKLSLEVVEVAGKEIDHKSQQGSEIALPIKDGVTMVSVKEYVNKRLQNPMFDLLLRMSPMYRTAKPTILYCDDWLDAMTILPGSLWFMSPFGI